MVVVLLSSPTKYIGGKIIVFGGMEVVRARNGLCLIADLVVARAQKKTRSTKPHTNTNDIATTMAAADAPYGALPTTPRP